MIRRGFTIMELLVVIGVVALLMALLLPSLASVASNVRSTRCLMNLRQLALAAHSYSTHYQQFPIALRYENNGGSFRNISWDYVSVGNQVISPGVLWGFVNNPGEVLQCPDYHGAANVGEEFTGYNYNTTYIGGEAPFGSNGWGQMRSGVSPAACNRGAQCAMFGDAGRKNGSNRYMRAPMRSEGLSVSWSAIYSGGQAFRHAGLTNIAFVDGHVGSSSTAHKGNQATVSLLGQYLDFPKNGFLSDDDRAYDPN